MTEKEIIEFLEENFSIPEDKDLSEKSLPFLQGYLSIWLESEYGLDLTISEIGDLDLSYIKGLLSGQEMQAKSKTKEEDAMTEDSKVKQNRKDRIKNFENKDPKLVELMEKYREDGLTKIESLRKARRELFE